MRKSLRLKNEQLDFLKNSLISGTVELGDYIGQVTAYLMNLGDPEDRDDLDILNADGGEDIADEQQPPVNPFDEEIDLARALEMFNIDEFEDDDEYLMVDDTADLPNDVNDMEESFL